MCLTAYYCNVFDIDFHSKYWKIIYHTGFFLSLWKIHLPLTYLLYSALKLISLKEDDEDTFINLVSCAWVFKRSLNLSLFKEHIPTASTP